MKPSAFLALLPFFAGPLNAHPDPGHSLIEIDRHLAASPDDPQLLLRKAELFLQAGHPDLSLPITARLLEISPDDPTVLLARARVAAALGRFDQAIADATAITRRFPRFAGAWALLARLHHESGRPDEAIAAKLRQLDADGHPDPGDFLSAAAWLRDRGRTGDADAALGVLDRAGSVFGSLVGIQQSAIAIECSLGRYDAALARVDLLVGKYHPSVSFSLLRADIFEAAGRDAEAARACDSALALLDPTLQADASSTLRQEIARRKQANLDRASRPAP